MIPWQRNLKMAAEVLLVECGVARAGRRWHAGSCLILAFHNVLGPGRPPIGDRPLHLPLEEFERFVDRLASTHDIIALDGIRSRQNRPRPQAVLTFDDAYAGAIQFGLPALVARGIPATVFVAPGLLGRPACWWDQLADPRTGLDAATRTYALDVLRGEEDRILRNAEGMRPTDTGDLNDCRIATEAELARAASLPGITLGAHSWSHPNLARLSPEELSAELTRPLAWLEERYCVARPWLAYPYGLSSPRVEVAAKQAGYTLGFRVSGGFMNSSEPARMNLPRWSVSAGLSEPGFVLHAAGVMSD